MKQTVIREFAFIEGTKPPLDASAEILAVCGSYGDCILASLKLSDKTKTLSWLGKRLGIKSRGYMTDLSKGHKEVPRHLLIPIAHATGSRLILQFDEIKRGVKIVTGQETKIERIERVIEQTRRAA